jgi:LytS/YehU family sensor histidine kinase
MLRHIGVTLVGFILTYFVILAAISLGGSFTPGAGGIIGFSVGFSRMYTKDNSMISFSAWCLLISCMLGGIVAGYKDIDHANSEYYSTTETTLSSRSG